MSMNLYEIDQKIRNILDEGLEVNEETGEIFGIEELERLESDRADKIDGIAGYIMELQLLNIAIKNVIDKQKERIERNQCKIDRLKSYLSESLCGEKYESAKCKISYRTSRAVIIDDPEKIDHVYCTEKPIEYIPNKTLIGNAIKAGITVDGARIEERKGIIIK